MKTISILIAISVTMLTNSIMAQDFSQFENKKGVTSVLVTKQMFKLMSKLDLQSQDEDMQDYIKLVENLEDIKIFISQNQTTKNSLKAEVDNYLANTKLDLLMKVNDDDNQVVFYVKPGKTEDLVNQLFMYVNNGDSNDSETVVMLINGLIDLNEISKLTSQLDVPGAESLENLKNKKNK